MCSMHMKPFWKIISDHTYSINPSQILFSAAAAHYHETRYPRGSSSFFAASAMSQGLIYAGAVGITALIQGSGLQLLTWYYDLGTNRGDEDVLEDGRAKRFICWVPNFSYRKCRILGGLCPADRDILWHSWGCKLLGFGRLVKASAFLFLLPLRRVSHPLGCEQLAASVWLPYC